MCRAPSPTPQAPGRADRFSGLISPSSTASHRIGGSITFPNGQAATDGSCDEVLSCGHALSNRFLVGQTGSNGRGEDTTAPVCVLGVDALGPELGEITPVVKNIGGYAFEVAPLSPRRFLVPSRGSTGPPLSSVQGF
jgi:hypothetical protein